MRIERHTDQQLEEARKYLSSDALLYHVCHALASETPTSIVRMGDGEKAILDCIKNGTTTRSFLISPDWLKEYGLLGANLHHIAAGLEYAGHEADVLCLNTAGWDTPNYALAPLFDRRGYGEGLFAHSWAYMGRVYSLMKVPGDIIVVCRNAASYAYAMSQKFGRPFSGIEYGSWESAGRVLDTVSQSSAPLVLVSGGPSGKALIVDIAKHTGKVVIDTGSALVKFWATDSPRNGPPS